MQETWVRSLGQEYRLEKGMATHSSILAWRIPVDRGAWWATVDGVAQTKQLTSSSNSLTSVRSAFLKQRSMLSLLHGLSMCRDEKPFFHIFSFSFISGVWVNDFKWYCMFYKHVIHFDFKKSHEGTSLGICTPNSGGLGLIPAQGTRSYVLLLKSPPSAWRSYMAQLQPSRNLMNMEF